MENRNFTHHRLSRRGSWQPAGGCLAVPLVAFVLLFGLGGLVARVESDAELFYLITIDILIGAAIVGIAVLNRPHIIKRTRLLLPVVVFSLVISGLLIGWQSYAYHMRKHAYEHFLEQQSQSPEAHE